VDKGEARAIIEEVLTEFRQRSYENLATLVGEPHTQEAVGASGTTYQIEIEAIWESERGGEVRVIGAIDDGGWHAFMPLTASFIVAPDGTFVGE
jgi:hypothetical protein